MTKLITVTLVVAAFVFGVFVGRMSMTSLVLDGPGSSSETAPASAPTTGGAVISTTKLSAGQQRLLSTLGIDSTEIVVTPNMVACAEAKLGVARVAEIISGSTPSFSEGVSLLACYQQ
jgi:hypothetical protein